MFLHLLTHSGNITKGTSLAVQWLRLRAPTVEGMGLIPGQGTKIPLATRCSQNKKYITKDSIV